MAGLRRNPAHMPVEHGEDIAGTKKGQRIFGSRYLGVSMHRYGPGSYRSWRPVNASLRQATVSEACSNLLALNAIHYSRGSLAILDRSLLEHQSCECYQAVALAKLVAQFSPTSRVQAPAALPASSWFPGSTWVTRREDWVTRREEFGLAEMNRMTCNCR